MTTTSPLYAACHRCGARVLEVRWDFQENTLLGAPRLDPVTLNAEQHIACIVTGVSVWQVQRRRTGEWVTSHRNRWWPTRPVDGHTVPEHACGRRWEGPPLDIATSPSLTPEHCPF